METKIYIIALLITATQLTSCGGPGEKSIIDDSPAVNVRVSSVTQDKNHPFLTASGKIEAVKSADLSTRMMGYVDKIYVQVGDMVKKGQQLISINNADIRARLAQANAQITEASAAFYNTEKDFERFTILFKEQSTTQKELDNITARYRMAKAKLEGAQQMKNEIKAQLSYADIRAPFNAKVTNKFINVGDLANPGASLLEVEFPGKYQVLAMVPESEIFKIKTNAEVDVIIKSLNVVVKGKVDEVSTSAKNTGGQFLVKVFLEESDVNIMSGMYTTVQFPVEDNEALKTILIPKDAIVTRGQLTGIYTVSQSNTALLRWLRLGRTVGNQVEVLSGMSSNEQYIASSNSKLYNGAKINIQ